MDIFSSIMTDTIYVCGLHVLYLPRHAAAALTQHTALLASAYEAAKAVAGPGKSVVLGARGYTSLTSHIPSACARNMALMALRLTWHVLCEAGRRECEPRLLLSCAHAATLTQYAGDRVPQGRLGPRAGKTARCGPCVESVPAARPASRSFALARGINSN